MPASRLIHRWLSTCAAGFDALAFPWCCQICGTDEPGSAGPFCDDCRAELLEAAGAACSRCAIPVGPWQAHEQGCGECRGRPLGFDRAIALGPYQGALRALCLRLKRAHDAWLAVWLADLLIEASPELIREATGACVVPIPLHWRRRWQRGYNQAEAIADRVSRRLGRPLVRALRRVAATPALATRGRLERARLMRAAFQTRGRRTELLGRSVLLVDDILTTGATCGAAARALKRAGAGRVVAVVIGRAEGKV